MYSVCVSLLYLQTVLFTDYSLWKLTAKAGIKSFLYIIIVICPRI